MEWRKLNRETNINTTELKKSWDLLKVLVVKEDCGCVNREKGN
jgi:hypothetical protein